MRSWTVRLALLAVVVATIGCDQVAKHVASTHLAGGPPQSYLGGAFRLEYAENTGGFLSLGAELPEWARVTIFSVGNGILLVGCLVAGFTRRWRRLALLGLCLLFAGGLSNLVDRLLHGRVVDFLFVGIGPARTGIFNVADMAIMLGIALIVTGRPVGREPQ
jgi:signal peptidase II